MSSNSYLNKSMGQDKYSHMYIYDNTLKNKNFVITVKCITKQLLYYSASLSLKNNITTLICSKDIGLTNYYTHEN